jgi:cysteine desulfurase / selenocysteine lyase
MSVEAVLDGVDKSPALRSLVPKSDFLGLEHAAHLATGGEAPFLRSHLEALARFGLHKSQGMAGRERLFELVDETRAALARLLACEPQEVGFPYSVAHGMNMLAHSIEFQPGDNVVMEQWEFPSVLYPWIEQRKRRGVEVRLVAPEPGSSRASFEQLSALVDGRTRVLAISQVSYLTGERYDVSAISELTRAAGALLVVDATHALGAIPVYAPHADFLFSACYKWILGTHGVAVAYWNRRRVPNWRPIEFGWHSVEPQHPMQHGDPFELHDDARVFEAGNPGFAAIAVLHNALRYLMPIRIDRIEQHVTALSGRLHGRLVELGLRPLTPAVSEQRAGNVAFNVANEEHWRRELERRDVLAWTGDGRVRFSTHLFNDADDVDRAIAAVAEILERVERAD